MTHSACKEVKEFPLYVVFADGRVARRTETGVRQLKLEALKDGYPCVSLYAAGRKKFAYVHKLVAEAFLPPPSAGEIILHLNDVKTDNRVANLRWGTKAENIRHRQVPFWRRDFT